MNPSKQGFTMHSLNLSRSILAATLTLAWCYTTSAFSANGRPRHTNPEDSTAKTGDDATKKEREERKDKADDDKGRSGSREGTTTKSSIKAKASSTGSKRFGIGLEFGSNATYGNALVPHFNPLEYLDIQGGIGYNTTGVKIGAGAAFILPMGRFGLDGGGAFVHSNGVKDKVSLSAKFTPEGSKSDENVTVSKNFTITPANYISGFGGAFFDIVPAFRVLGHVNFNKVLSGNEVKFDGPVQYDTSVDASNDSEVEKDFDPKATKKLDIAGIGFSLGAQFRF
jgi:hypothetical protein